ncbi:hypothetical protein ACJMK2_014937 [Sinanodonta woodiana]|uniref:Uncharacterized protein n=1 Tax=Sinanodonta woodiana TaxID=1069815 RepID=A0ABD3V2G2_SINWO
MKLLIVVAVLINLSYQETTVPDVPSTRSTHAPQPTRETSVHHEYRFHYDYVTQKMVLHEGNNCYIFTLNDQEKVDVHTDAGLTNLEIKFMQMIDTGTRTEVTAASLDRHLTLGCGARTLEHYYTIS